MNAASADHEEDNSRYFRDAAELRFNVQMSKDDYEFSVKGNRIVYLVDANVVSLFLNPATEAHLVTPFVSDRRSEHLAGTALITAEFLFSRMLTGQQNTPVFITPAHFHEVVNFVNAQEDKPEMLEPGEAAGPPTRGVIQELVAKLRAGTITREAVIDRLRRDVPVVLHHLLNGRFGITVQLLRLYESDLLRPLDLHPAVTNDILHPPRSEINEWIRLISDERRLTERLRHLQKQTPPEAAAPHRQAGARRNKDADDLQYLRENMERDAASIVQLLRLNEAAQATNGPRTRYVLITADRSLFRAYAFWFWTKKDPSPEPTQFALRLPTQYAPVLKIEEMPNCVENSDIIKRTSETLDGLLKNIHTVDRNKYPYTLPYHIGLDFRDHSLRQTGDGETRRETFRQFFNLDLYCLRGDPEVFRGIKSDWAAAYRNAEVLNAELMTNRARAEFEPLATLLKENASLRDALVSQQRKLLQSVEARHTQFSIFNNYFRMLPQAAHRAGRGPMAIRLDFSALTGEHSFNAFVSALDRDPDRGIGRVTQVAHRLRSKFDHTAMLFAACAAYRCEDWPAARHYAERAIDLLSSPDGMTQSGRWPDRHEADHLIACTLRFTVSPDSESGEIDHLADEADRLLKAGLRYFERLDDALGCYRAKSELAALNLTAAYALRMAAPSHPESPPPGAARRIQATAQEIKEAASVRALIPPDGAEDFLKVVDTQFYANIISLEAYLLHVGPEDGAGRLPADMVERALAEMEARVESGGYPTVLAVELAVVRWSLEGDPRRRRLLHERFRALCGEALKPDSVLTDLDRGELEWFHARCDRPV